MRVLIISTNRETLPDPVAPIGAAYVITALRSAGHDARLLDLQFAPDIAVSVKEAVRTLKPQVVGLSIKNIDNAAFPHSTSYLPEISAVVKMLRALGVRHIVPGGSGFSVMPAETLRYLGLNVGIVGEGEDAFPELLRRMTGGHPVNAMPGLAYRYKDKFFVNAPRRITHLDVLPEPERAVLDNAMYMSEGGAGNIQTKRGCAYACIHCPHPAIEGRKVRLRRPALAADEFVRTAKEHGLRHIFIVDNVFNHPPEHAKEFCRELIARGNTAAWSCYANPALMDEELAALMVEAGCRGVEFGTDSAVDGVLANLKKGFSADDVLRASKICREAGLSFCHGLLLGAPGETADTVKRTLDAMDVAAPNAVVAMLGLRIYPGTELAKRAKAEGRLMDEPGTRPCFYFSQGLEMDKVKELLLRYGREHANFIMPGIHLRMTDDLRVRLRSAGFTGPLWEYLSGR